MFYVILINTVRQGNSLDGAILISNCMVLYTIVKYSRVYGSPGNGKTTLISKPRCFICEYCTRT